MTETYDRLAARTGRSAELLRRLSAEMGLSPSSDGHLGPRTPRSCRRSSRPSRWPTTRSSRATHGSTEAPSRSSSRRASSSSTRRSGSVSPRSTCRRGEGPHRLRRGASYSALASELVPWLQRRIESHRPRVPRRRHGGLPGGTRDRARARAPAAGDRVPRPRGLHGARRGTRRRGRGRARLGPGNHRPGGIAERGGQPVKWLGDGVMFHFPAHATRSLRGSTSSSRRSGCCRCLPGSGSTPARSWRRKATSSGGR